MIYPLIPAQQHYSWGSSTLIPHHLGIENPKNLPLAEIWFGTHPRGTSVIEHRGEKIPLSDAINRDPRYWTGDEGEEVPFLLKILGIGSPLSIQCHPSAYQAREGYERENKAGIPLESSRRTYRDTRGKPEIICALTPFTALCGFVPLAEAILRLPMLDHVEDHRSLLKAVWSLSPEELARCTNTLHNIHTPWAELVRSLERLYPGDPGILAPCYLNLVQLEPGEALFLDAGVLHAYMAGLGVELMGNSDNVIRGGLTEKYIDREELQRIVHNSSSDVPSVDSVELSSGHRIYPVPVEEFLLHRFSEGVSICKDRDILEIGCVTTGEVSLTEDGGDTFTFTKGSAFVIPASCSSYEISTDGELYVACAGGRT